MEGRVKVTSENIDQAQAMTKSKSAKKTTAPSASASAQKTEGVNNASASVHLSERVQDMKKIRETVDQIPDVNEAKVARLKAMIASGEYKPDAKKIADKMVDEYAYNGVIGEEKK